MYFVMDRVLCPLIGACKQIKMIKKTQKKLDGVREVKDCKQHMSANIINKLCEVMHLFDLQPNIAQSPKQMYSFIFTTLKHVHDI